MLQALVTALIYVVVGAICIYLIDKFVRDRRLANLLRILVVLVVVLYIVHLLLPLLGLGGVL